VGTPSITASHNGLGGVETADVGSCAGADNPLANVCRDHRARARLWIQAVDAVSALRLAHSISTSMTWCPGWTCFRSGVVVRIA
jgi:hypothetical protein